MSLRRANTPRGVQKYLPITQWLPRYSSIWLRADLLAGLTTAAVVIPQSMAYATIAGLPVEIGLYAALVPMVVYAVMGTSRVLSVSVTSTISLLTAATLIPIVGDGSSTEYLTAATTLAVLVGAFLILAAIFRLGFLANLISQPVLTGFKAGIGVVILVGQFGKVLGLSLEKTPILETLYSLLLSLDQIHWATFLVALATLAVLIVLPRLTTRLSAPLVAVALSILASALLNLESLGVTLVGEIPSGLPSFTPPDLSLLAQLWPGALGIALLSFIESIAAGRSFTRKNDPPVEANQELFALSLANLGGGLFQAYPGGGGTSQTAVNREAGARTQISTITTAGAVALTLLFLAPLIGLMPQAALGALVMVAAAGLIHVTEFQALRRIRRTEFIWAIIAFVGVVLLGTLEGILIAVAISILTIFYEASYPPIYALGRKPGTNVFRPRSSDHPEDEIFPELLILRTEGRMNFASAPNTTDKLWALVREAEPKVVVLDMSAIPDLEYTALQLLIKFEEDLKAEGIKLGLVALNPEPLKIIRRSQLADRLGEGHMAFNLEQAVERFEGAN